MKKSIFSVLLVIIFFVLQTTVLKNIALAGISPNLIILLPVAWGFLFGKTEGLLTGFFLGLLMDVFCGMDGIIGIYALMYMLIGYVNGILKEYLSARNKKLPYGLIAGSELVYGVVNYLIFFMLRSRFDFSWYLGNVIIPEWIYTLFLSVPVYPLLEKISVSLSETEKRSVD